MLSLPVAGEHVIEARAFSHHFGFTGGGDRVVDGGQEHVGEGRDGEAELIDTK